MIRRSDRGSAPLATLIAVFAAGSLVGAVAAVEVVPADKLPAAQGQYDPGSVVTNPNAPSATGGPAVPGASSGPLASQGPGQVPANVVAPSKYQCRAGANGGATDRGVTGSEIHLATTIVASGPGKSFLGEMRYAMEAVIDEVNRTGGICGRKLTLQTRDDSWSPSTGAQYLRNYIQDKNIFAIPVGASSEGLRVVVDSGDLDGAQFPAVGTDGLAINQYAKSNGSAQQWVWPVATATVSSARIMAKDACDRGAKNPGVVFDNDYKFGSEAAAAFSKEFERLCHQPVKGTHGKTCSPDGVWCGIAAAQPSYSTQVRQFYGNKPDYVALFVEPDTGLTWMRDQNTPAASDRSAATGVPLGYNGAQPLFTKQFESQCRSKCDQMVVWSGFKPYLEKYKNDPTVQKYVQALKQNNRQADEYNQFTQSAYVGMQFFVTALRAVGPELTRQRLKAVLDAITYTDGLTLQGTMRFTAANRFANITMQAFTMQYKGTPALWRLGPVKTDPRPQAD